MTTVIDAVKKIRWELRLSQQALAKELECTQTAISAWELGNREPNYKMLKKIVAFARKHKIKVSLL